MPLALPVWLARVISPDGSTTYAYDANGNRTGGGYQTGTGNQLLSDWSTDYEYDAEGNRTRKREIPVLAAGADAGGGPHVRVYDAQTGAMRGEFFAYDAAFTGGVRVAVGDVNGDGFHDIVTAQGPNTDPAQPTEIRIFHGANGALLGSFAALGAWSGGAFVAVGDVNGDGNADIIAAADNGGGPHVRVYSGADLTGQTMLWEFFAYDSTFGGGVRVAVGDVSGDGLADLITTQGPNTTDPTEIRVFRGTDAALLASFDALGAWTGGAFVAAGDMNADGRADIYAGADAGGGPHVRVYSGADLTGQTMLRDFHAYDPLFSGGVRVAAADADRDGRADLVTVQGPTTTGTPSEVRVFRGTDGTLLTSYAALGAWTGGAFTGGNGQEALEDVSYQWDHRNRLIEVTDHAADGSASKVVAYDYDVFDMRIGKHVDDNGDGLFDRSERYVYDGGNIVLAFDAGGSLTHRYLHGDAIDRVFADENAVNEILWALSDNQGTVRDWAEYNAATDTTTVVNHVEFNSFGRIVSQSDPTATVFYAYTGQEWDADAQAYYYAARWYDPATGRFIAEDPIGFSAGDTNLSRYVGNSPTNFTDPTGLDPWYETPVTPVEYDPETGVTTYPSGPSPDGPEEGPYDDIMISTPEFLKIPPPELKIGIIIVPFGPGAFGCLGSLTRGGAGRYLANTWHRGTFPNRMQSVQYHVAKHGNGRTGTQYTRDAMDFFQRNKHLGEKIILKDGTCGIKIQTKIKVLGEKVRRVGGYWTKDGKLVTFWD